MLKHIKTQFLFTDTKYQYQVVCNAAKRGEIKFQFYKDGEYIGSRTPNGGHATHTSAKNQLQRFLNKED